MEVLFLGTGGADWPNEQGEAAFYRHHSSILVNGKILVDPAPGIFEYACKLPGVDLSGLVAVVVTHTHPDHWSTDTLEKLLGEVKGKVSLYYHTGAKPNLHLEGVSKHGKGLSKASLKKLVLCPMRRGQKAEIAGTSWLNLEANHICDHGERGSHYTVSKGDKTFFYGCDGGWFTTKTWDVIRAHQFDAVILDGTVGEDSFNYRIAGHNTLEMNRILKGAMEAQGALKEGARVYLSHFGKNTYDKGPEGTSETVRKAGFIPAEDGLCIKV